MHHMIWLLFKLIDWLFFALTATSDDNAYQQQYEKKEKK
jgi:hypothetical protein